ncbi:MAG: VOC family protein [Actinomycetota bacterium]|nr:VOC family protein [Actinomycetota bacterium]
MPTRSDPWPNGTPCWVDVSVPDVEAAKSFYGPVLGWPEFVDTGEDFGHYNIATVNGQSVAAIGPLQYDGQTSSWTVYIASDDVDGSAKLIADNGGTVVAPPMDIPGSGRMLIAQDPQGAAFGVWQSAGMHGSGLYMEPGALAWTDVRTSDPDGARAFYSAVFDYRFEPMDGAPEDYQLIRFDGARDGEAVGGIGGFMGGPEGGGQPHWLSYFSVADADASAAAATAGGGSLQGEPMDTPFGRMIGITDPFGATFFVVGAPPSA